ncbi:hypothetical protein BpHYR1_023942 [Brachionus plicatilis]|uniref:Uncharacterized protein n=1 Tax=Brachionus plicatilis TaxID=10195 RepID=A0A3M7R148_BRAPC|nr:hypothetical protein BpHYR1_023942 [Brachionus plicatilis]
MPGRSICNIIFDIYLCTQILIIIDNVRQSQKNQAEMLKTKNVNIGDFIALTIPDVDKGLSETHNIICRIIDVSVFIFGLVFPYYEKNKKTGKQERLFNLLQNLRVVTFPNNKHYIRLETRSENSVSESSIFANVDGKL